MIRRLMLFAALLILSVSGLAYAEPPVLGGCQLFPEDNPWNTDISNAPVHPKSAAYIANINSNGGKFVHPDFGEDPSYGIPWTTVDDTQPLVPVTFDYDDESDPGPYPIPPDAPVEGGGDRHVLVIDTSHCILYETWASEYQGGPDHAWTAGSGAIFDLTSNALRPDGWTSADAAGLPILPGLANCAEANSGTITHALRFTVNRTQKAYVYPATHYASNYTASNYPPMGLRFRLKASYNTSNLTGQALAIANGLKKYGMILADNGSNWYISGETNPGCWNDDELNQLKAIPGTAFEVVVSPAPPALAWEFLSNGGFEGADVNKLPLAWTGKNISKDKRVCNKVSALEGIIKQVAYEGHCAFKFKGVPGEKSKLKQTVNVSTLGAGDFLLIRAQASGKNVPAAAGKMMVKVIYSDATKEKFTLTFDAATYDYTAFDVENQLDLAPTKFKVQLKYTGTSGKLTLDRVSVRPGLPSLLPLPQAD